MPQRAGNSGFRAAERLLAQVVDIRGGREAYLTKLGAPPPGAFCWTMGDCRYEKEFPISLGIRTRVALLLELHLRAGEGVLCDRLASSTSCTVAVSVFTSGEETAPGCVRAAPVRRAAKAVGWEIYRPEDRMDGRTTRYRWRADPDLYLFVHTLADTRCLRIAMIMRIQPVHPVPWHGPGSGGV